MHKVNDTIVHLGDLADLVKGTEGAPLADRRVHNLYISAATLRSVMGLTQRGPKNKDENIERAYRFIDQSSDEPIDYGAAVGIGPGIAQELNEVMLGGVGYYCCTLPHGGIGRSTP